MDPKKLKSFVDKSAGAPKVKNLKKPGAPFGGKKPNDEEEEGGNPGDEEGEDDLDEDEGDEAPEDEGDEEGGGEGGESDAPDVDVKAIGEEVQNGEGDARLVRLSKKISDENNPPQWVLDEETWEKASDAVEPYWDEYDEPYAVVTHVYKAMGGAIQGDPKDNPGPAEDEGGSEGGGSTSGGYEGEE
jgi:hypothetical protein